MDVILPPNFGIDALLWVGENFKTSFYVLERQDETTEARDATGVGLCNFYAVNTTVAIKTIVAGRCR